MIKKILYSLFFFFVQSAICFAQPANDNPCTAQNLGTLPTPAACPSGIGTTLNIAGNTTGATPESPYLSTLNCTGTGGTVQSSPAKDVWYSFIASGYQCVIRINSAFANPNIAMYAGTCSALGGGVGGCAVGTAGTTTLNVTGMVIGTTYYLQISGSGSQTGTFNFDIANHIGCANCVLSSSLVANPLPVNNTYQPGQTVNFVYHVSQFTQVNTNWFHGVQLNFGSGWNLGSLTTSPPAPCQTSTMTPGNWAYYPSGITASNNGSLWPPGFYFDGPLGAGCVCNNGNPGDNFGDNCTGSIPSSAWNFGFSITVSAGGTSSNLYVTVNASADGESGSWSSIGCSADAPTTINVVSNPIKGTELAFYNSFSPNGDGLNDIFEIDNISEYATNHVYIYNRWGQLLWDGTNYDNVNVVWDGKDNSKNLLSAGTYFYVIDIDGKKVEKHWVELTK